MYTCTFVPLLSPFHTETTNKAGYYIGIKRQFIYLSSPPVLTPLSRTHSYNHWCKTQHQLVTHTHTHTHTHA